MEDSCANSSVTAIGIVFVAFSFYERKYTHVGFDNDPYNKSTSIGAAASVIYFSNVTIIDRLNETLLLHGGYNYILYS